MPQVVIRRRLVTSIAALAVALVAAASVWLITGRAEAGTLSGSLYRDPNGSAAAWVAANPNDSRAAAIRTRIASQPAARWLASFNPSSVQNDTAAYVGGANAAGQVPVFSVYEIPNRDCGGASAGGAPDLNQYQTWITNFSRGLGTRTVIVILETDALALQTCLSGSEITARDQALSTAVQTIKSANANAKVYLDGGHSAWNSAGDQANRLLAAGVARADGFFTNVSNFNPTGNEASYGRSILSALSAAGVNGKHQIIDTSRNGGAAGDWCADDNTDRRIGQYPTLSTGDNNVDGFLWVKPPGEADGCSFAAGSFQPTLAASLVTGVADPPGGGNPPPTTPATTPPTTPPPTTPPATTPPASGRCSATFQVTNSWSGGFQGQVTVTAGTAAIRGWTVRWTLASGQSISQLWNGALTVSGSSVIVANLSYNGALGAGASTNFGFTANGPTSTPTVSCTAS